MLTRFITLTLAAAGALALILTVVVGIVDSPVRVQAQENPSTSLQFEVASIRPNTSGREDFSIENPSHGNFSARNVTVMKLILTSFRLVNAQVLDGPDWITSARFDVAAKGIDTAATADVYTMVRRLVVDRCNLKCHLETRNLPVYALTIAKKGHKLGKPENGPCGSLLKAGQPCVNLMEFKNGLGVSNVSLPTIAMELGRILGDRVVVDRTGLEGKFDMNVLWANGAPRSTEEESTTRRSENADSPFVALEEQAGLKLESSKDNVNVLVIEHIERPSEN